MINVQIVLFDGFDLLDAVAPYEVFCAAGLLSDAELCVGFVTAEGPRPVRSGTNGVKLEAAGTLAPERKGIIVVPGASGKLEGDGPDSIPVILSRAMNTELTKKVEQALRCSDTVVATVCGGSLLLAMGGLLEGRRAVTNRLGMGLLGATGAEPIMARVVDDGNLITGGGVTSGLDVALYVVERELGPQVAHAVEQLFEFERRGTVWQSSGIPAKETVAQDGVSAAALKDVPAGSEDIPNNNETAASLFDGEWDTIMATPVGKLEVRLHITTVDGAIRGTATMDDETIVFTEPELAGGRLRWSQRITKPMRLHLKFEVTVAGNEMSGIAKAGLLPASKLTGKRLVK